MVLIYIAVSRTAIDVKKSDKRAAMIIKSIRVQNFRCIKDETLPCEQLTALIGANGAGKSSFLRALDMFYTAVAKYSDDDFYNKDTSQSIVITVTFTELAVNEKELFQKYVEGEELTVEKEMKFPGIKANQKYYGARLKNSDFEPFRTAGGVALKKEYEKLHKEEKYSDLPVYSNKDLAEEALQSWEELHPDYCTRSRDEGQFFGFKEVGKARLEQYTRFIRVPAVRDATEDAAEGKGAALTEIMDLVVRSVLMQRQDIIDLEETTQHLYDKIMDPSKLEELQGLEENLSNTLRTYVPDAGVELDWHTEDAIRIPLPSAGIRLIEDEYPSSVGRTGHGLQRAFILTMLQHLAQVQSLEQVDVGEEHMEVIEVVNNESPIKMPNLIIGIEEPELYQHPNRQRHLAKIFLKLTIGSIDGVAENTQIIHTTHSPLFVDIKQSETVRVLRKVLEEEGKPKQTKVIYTNLDNVAKIIEKADGKPEGTYSGISLTPRLKTLMTPWMNEGFFADVIVLVEGEQDRAALIEMAKNLDYDLESRGISVIPCMGKNNLSKATAIFRELQIPTYVIWDSDFDSEAAKEANHKLLRLFDRPTEDYPEGVTEDFACFKKTLNDTLRGEIGEDLFDETFESCRQELCLKKDQAEKNPIVIQEIIIEATEKGKSSKTLEEIIAKIISLKSPEASL
jgi:predicted ATP-dependent endonuclease of OLD family